MMAAPLSLRNGEAVGLGELPELGLGEFRDLVIREVEGGSRLAALLGQPVGERLRLLAVLARDALGTLSLASTQVENAYPALTPHCLQAHAFEREIAEQWGVLPQGHPWLKPLRFHAPYRPNGALSLFHQQGDILPGVADFFRVEGEEIHQVAVGPVHAGVIEPGHFRFQCHGERVLHLEIALGYQHRGLERALIGGPDRRTVHYLETAAGDTSVGHATAYCQALESLSGSQVPPRAQALRGIALELERLANHAGDLGALANDVAYLPTASYCGRLRGEFLNMTALICGSRLGRGLVRPGGVGFDIDARMAGQLLDRLETAAAEMAQAVGLLWDSSSVLSRFEDTGKVSGEWCRELGLVGLAARASGLERDVRFDFPSGIFRFAHIPVSTGDSGDVFARAYVRWLEAQRSIEFARAQLQSLPQGPCRASLAKMAGHALTASLVEGWRGEICHVALTNGDGRFALYKIVDPSFHNWMGLALALREGQISDFPLCNKSFNLSYCGHDL
jgi:Ni,Fe-hydrogenase III large subunit